ncbi:Uncharacterized protein FWK35_00032435 [Aphis craccivora]|uniref:Uncharacterized protein n=1 Tax=Aphis craccivora TaxID=307492 RepID=A0A6G0VRN3_APHCR|nr:Uncharacterized protein FWK35_00032435 [Aphis craccivora]
MNFYHQLIDLKIMKYFLWSELLKWQKNTSSNDTIIISNVSNAIVNAQVGVKNSSKKAFELKLDEVLQSSGKGSLIIDYYRKNNKLNNGITTTLVDFIISYMITK